MLILGIDPGISNTGYGILDYSSNKISLIDYGIISTSAKEKNNERLFFLFNQINILLDKFSPDHSAIEEAFYGKNIKSTGFNVNGISRTLYMTDTPNEDLKTGVISFVAEEASDNFTILVKNAANFEHESNLVSWDLQLTPHVVSPADSSSPISERLFANFGIFNLGYLSARKTNSSLKRPCFI